MVSKEYLEKVRFAIRRNANSEVDRELTDIIEHCREDLIRVGVAKDIACDESNKSVLGCQRAFARWQFGIGGDDAERNREDYRLMADELRKSVTEEKEAV